MKYLLKCCGRIVDVDNKPIWCSKCGEHNIDISEVPDKTLLPCPFCGGEAMEEGLNSVALHWYECEDCGASSGSADSLVEARKKWNGRK